MPTKLQREYGLQSSFTAAMDLAQTKVLLKIIIYISLNVFVLNSLSVVALNLLPTTKSQSGRCNA